MNTAKVQQIINQLIEEKQRQIRYARQYPVAKHQLVKLEELGILNLMPAKFGHTDAAVIIAAATNAKTAVMNAYGEGEELSASDLYAAIHEVESNVQITVSDRDNQREIGDLTIRVQFPTHANDKTLRIYGWNNNHAEDTFGDCEVEIDTVEIRDEEYERVIDNGNEQYTFTLSQQKIADALALYNEIYMNETA